jgi:hypothetical protein
MTKLAAAAAAFTIMCFISSFLITRTMQSNREIEWDANKKSELLTPSELHWTVVHIRDDIGSATGLLAITNALLAAILAAVLF